MRPWFQCSIIIRSAGFIFLNNNFKFSQMLYFIITIIINKGVCCQTPDRAVAVSHHLAQAAIRPRTVIEEEERPFVEHTKPMIPICPVVSFTYGEYKSVIGIDT